MNNGTTIPIGAAISPQVLSINTRHFGQSKPRIITGHCWDPAPAGYDGPPKTEANWPLSEKVSFLLVNEESSRKVDGHYILPHPSLLKRENIGVQEAVQVMMAMEKMSSLNNAHAQRMERTVNQNLSTSSGIVINESWHDEQVCAEIHDGLEAEEDDEDEPPGLSSTRNSNEFHSANDEEMEQGSRSSSSANASASTKSASTSSREEPAKKKEKVQDPNVFSSEDSDDGLEENRRLAAEAATRMRARKQAEEESGKRENEWKKDGPRENYRRMSNAFELLPTEMKIHMATTGAIQAPVLPVNIKKAKAIKKVLESPAITPESSPEKDAPHPGLLPGPNNSFNPDGSYNYQDKRRPVLKTRTRSDKPEGEKIILKRHKFKRYCLKVYNDPRFKIGRFLLGMIGIIAHVTSLILEHLSRG